MPPEPTSAYLKLLRQLTPEQVALLDEVEQAIRADERREREDETFGGYLPPELREPERPIRGDVGTIVGPPIEGTNDRINAGPARVDDEPARAVEGEVIAPLEDPPSTNLSWPRWQPAGEVGFVSGAGTEVVEDPKNDARPIVPQIPPTLVDGFVVPDGYEPGRTGLCRSCHASIMWMTTPAGKAAPINPDGVNHFATCPQAESWRRR